MPLNNPTSHHTSVVEYQVSGIPYVTSSTATEVLQASATAQATHIKFPSVTQWFSVFCIGSNPVHVGFTQNGVRDSTATTTLNRFTVPAVKTTDGGVATSGIISVRCKELFFLGDGGTTGFQVVAGLTAANSGSFPTLTGSLITSGALGIIGVG